VEAGEVRLWLTAKSGRRSFKVVGPGTVLGLSETMTGGDYELSAEAAEGARISWVERDIFLRCLHRDHQLCLQIVRLLSEDLHSLY
jgi:CRP-like cAMP-binding protein